MLAIAVAIGLAELLVALTQGLSAVSDSGRLRQSLIAIAESWDPQEDASRS